MRGKQGSITKAGSAFASGMRGEEKMGTSKRAYHPNQAVTAIKDQPEGEQAGATVGGVKEEPSVFSSGMRGAEKYSPAQDPTAPNPLEHQVENESENLAVKGLPAGSEIIGTSKTHHIVRIPYGGASTKAGT